MTKRLQKRVTADENNLLIIRFNREKSNLQKEHKTADKTREYYEQGRYLKTSLPRDDSGIDPVERNSITECIRVSLLNHILSIQIYINLSSRKC